MSKIDDIKHKILKKIGNDLIIARQVRGIKQRELAEMAGVSSRLIKKMQAGSPSVRAGDLVSVIVALDGGERAMNLMDFLNDTVAQKIIDKKIDNSSLALPRFIFKRE